MLHQYKFRKSTKRKRNESLIKFNIAQNKPWCPYFNSEYLGPYSNLDDYPDLVELIKAETLHPDSIIEKFREGLDTGSLNISGNPISEEGFKALSDNCVIKNLDITVRKIGEQKEFKLRK